MPQRQFSDNRVRVLLTQECARIMAEEGVKDYGTAKRKAAARLGVSNRGLLPGNAEIEQALLDYRRLFQSHEQIDRLKTLRRAALEAMDFLERFRPRLVGSVLSGSAGAYSDINLHLFADTPEEVVLFLMEHNIPFETGERRLRLSRGGYGVFQVFTFAAGEVSVDLTVFDRLGEREPPLSPVDGKPMRRAGPAQVRALLEESEGAAMWEGAL